MKEHGALIFNNDHSFVDYPSHGHNLLSYKNKVRVRNLKAADSVLSVLPQVTFESMVLSENKTWISPTCIVSALS